MEPTTGTLSNVNKIVHNFEKNKQRKMQKRENTMISFIMKATRINQESSILITKLQRENAKNVETIQLLTIENEIKENLIREKEEELAASKTKIKNLECQLLRLDKEKIHDKYKSISTFQNITVVPNEKTITESINYNHEIVPKSSTTNGDITDDMKSTDSGVILSKSLRNKKKTKTMFMYNLRKRNNK